MGLSEYLLSKIPPEIAKKWKLNSDDNEKVDDPIPTGLPIHTNFRLPITYLDPSVLHSLSPIISQDLELSVPGSTNSIYDYLFRPVSSFGRNMTPLWSQYYTTDIAFLNDTQKLIKQLPRQKNIISSCLRETASDYVPDYDKFRDIWRELKEDKLFLEKYGYMEWSMLAQFNENSSFLQCLSMVNVISPVISLFLPLIFIILPFIILKIQRIPINFTVYLEVLQSVAKNHFIGKAIMSITSFSWDKAAYLMMTAALYFLQIYQNVSICHRFYRNMIRINENLVEMVEFVNRSIQRMEGILDIVCQLPTYFSFNNDLRKHCESLKNLQFELSLVHPFNHTVSKFSESGYMLRCFYRLHSVPEYDAALRYATGFEGYMENLDGICSNLADGKIHMATFSSDCSGCSFVGQYYPPLLSEGITDGITEAPVVNTVELNKNMILSGPNKAGKTTVLKSTALNIIFTQQTGCGFYSSAKLRPYTHLHSYLNIPDTSGRDSLFQAESRRCKDILDRIKEGAVGSRHFCIFDELYSGTNPEEATKAGYAFLKYLSGFENVDFMLTTHYVKICKKFLKSERVQNYKMDVRVLYDDMFDYTYKIKKGISKIQGAIRVMKDMEYPEEIINGME